MERKNGPAAKNNFPLQRRTFPTAVRITYRFADSRFADSLFADSRFADSSFADFRFADSRFADNYDSNSSPCLTLMIGSRRVPKTLMIGSSYLVIGNRRNGKRRNGNRRTGNRRTENRRIGDRRNGRTPPLVPHGWTCTCTPVGPRLHMAGQARAGTAD